jgi:hypothetical protein
MGVVVGAIRVEYVQDTCSASRSEQIFNLIGPQHQSHATTALAHPSMCGRACNRSRIHPLQKSWLKLLARNSMRVRWALKTGVRLSRNVLPSSTFETRRDISRCKD